MVTYAGGAGAERFRAAIALSDGTFLLAGGAEDLDWIPANVPREEIPAAGIDSKSTGKIGFLAQLGADLKTIQRVVHFPKGTVTDVNRIRTTSLPGQPTATIYVSGSRDNAATDGYYLARLDGNFLKGSKVGVAWTHNVSAQNGYKSIQPWDVGAEGSVTFGEGAEFTYDWAQISRLSPEGKLAVVENWPVHWPASGEYNGPASSYPSGGAAALTRSGIVLKAGRRGSLRSMTQADYDLIGDDGNGNTRQGKWPDDYYFSGPCLPAPGACAEGPGYTGYRTSDKPTQRLGGIVVDRKTGDMYYGYSTQSKLPDGNPDFEPAVVAMDKTGKMKWWSRLYQETSQNSTPDQYVDHLAIDHATGTLVVLARAHGNNVINFWSGDKVAANPAASSFHNGFTGTQGNIHISWLGKLTLDKGALRSASWVAEYQDGMSGTGKAYADPNLDGWSSHNESWPDLNTTRVSSLEVDAEGRVFLTAVGRRTITTAKAYQKMIKKSEGSSTWNAFVRVFTPELDTLVYSSLIVGTWDPVDGKGGGNTVLSAVVPLEDGVLTVGHHEADMMTGVAKGNPIPTMSVPAWGTDKPAGESAIFAHLLFNP